MIYQSVYLRLHQPGRVPGYTEFPYRFVSTQLDFMSKPLGGNWEKSEDKLILFESNPC